MAAPPLASQPFGRVSATPTRAIGDPGSRPHGDGGALLAVCGVAPGAGATTLSRLIALAAAQHGAGKVMLCHTGRPPEAIAATVPALVLRRLLRLFIRPPAEHACVPRALAAPKGHSPSECARFGRRLVRARGAYSLTVVDCGTLREPLERVALAHATHLAWVLPASTDGLAHARRATRELQTPAGRDQLVIARAEPGERPRSLRALRQLADEHAATLILAPWQSPHAIQRDGCALEGAQIALQAILGVLDRWPARA